MDAVGDKAKGTKDGSAESKAAATTDSTRISPDDCSGITYRIERRLKIKAARAAEAARAARKRQKLDEAMTPRRRLMTTEVRHNKALLNRESNINMVQQKRILKLIKRQEKLEALHTQRIIVNEKVKLERKEQRRLKWIEDSKRDAYLWEMNNYMSRGRLNLILTLILTLTLVLSNTMALALTLMLILTATLIPIRALTLTL